MRRKRMNSYPVTDERLHELLKANCEVDYETNIRMNNILTVAYYCRYISVEMMCSLLGYSGGDFYKCSDTFDYLQEKKYLSSHILPSMDSRTRTVYSITRLGADKITPFLNTDTLYEHTKDGGKGVWSHDYSCSINFIHFLMTNIKGFRWLPEVVHNYFNVGGKGRKVSVRTDAMCWIDKYRIYVEEDLGNEQIGQLQSKIDQYCLLEDVSLLLPKTFILLSFRVPGYTMPRPSFSLASARRVYFLWTAFEEKLNRSVPLSYFLSCLDKLQKVTPDKYDRELKLLKEALKECAMEESSRLEEIRSLPSRKKNKSNGVSKKDKGAAGAKNYSYEETIYTSGAKTDDESNYLDFDNTPAAGINNIYDDSNGDRLPYSSIDYHTSDSIDNNSISLSGRSAPSVHDNPLTLPNDSSKLSSTIHTPAAKQDLKELADKDISLSTRSARFGEMAFSSAPIENKTAPPSTFSFLENKKTCLSNADDTNTTGDNNYADDISDGQITNERSEWKGAAGDDKNEDSSCIKEKEKDRLQDSSALPMQETASINNELINKSGKLTNGVSGKDMEPESLHTTEDISNDSLAAGAKENNTMYNDKPLLNKANASTDPVATIFKGVNKSEYAAGVDDSESLSLQAFVSEEIEDDTAQTNITGNTYDYGNSTIEDMNNINNSYTSIYSDKEQTNNTDEHELLIKSSDNDTVAPNRNPVTDATTSSKEQSFSNIDSKIRSHMNRRRK